MYKGNLLVFFVAFICFSCDKSELNVVWEWEHSANDLYIEFFDEHEAFVETNEDGVIGGLLTVQLPRNRFFSPGAQDNVVFLNVPSGLTPVVTLNDSMTRMQITLSGKAENHSEGYSQNDIFMHVPADYIAGVKNGLVEIKNVKVLFHDVPCFWKSPITMKEYLLVFNDEFNNDKIDTRRWKFRAETRKITRAITFNNKPIEIVVENEASVLENGNLVLKVYKKENEPGSIYTGGILSLDKFMPRYGYFETYASFKDCDGFGYWPAFWLHFDNKDRNSDGTEIDIFEYIPKSKTIYQTLHWYINNEHFSSSENFMLENLTGYHRFGLEWTPDELIFYVDGEITRHLMNSENERFVPDAYQMVYFSMSAGTWGGNVAHPSNKLPASTKFDYCRVYQSPGQDAKYKSNLGEKLIYATDRHVKY